MTDLLRLVGKRVLITGASPGIGADIAETFAAASTSRSTAGTASA